MDSIVGNTVVIVLFGLLIGGASMVFVVVTGPLPRVQVARKEPGESYLEYIRRVGEERANATMVLPRLAWLVEAIYFGVFALMVVLISFTPLRMTWLPFIISCVVGFVLSAGIFAKIRTGSIRATFHFIDEAFGDDKPYRQTPKRRAPSDK